MSCLATIKLKIVIGPLLGIILLLLSNCKSPLKAVESSAQIKTEMSAIPIPNGYEIVREGKSYVQLKKGNAFIRICESYPDTLVNSCDIMLLPLRGMRSNMRSSKVTRGNPYKKNGFEIRHLHKLDPGGQVNHAYELHRKKDTYRLVLFGTGLSEQGEYELKWMAENCYWKE